jgi:hypothetical protein
MRAVIRLAVCVVLAASSTAAFAEGNDPPSAGNDQQDRATLMETKATTTSDDNKDDADVGAASGEPMRAEARTASDARAREQAAARAYDEQLRQNEVWTSP